MGQLFSKQITKCNDVDDIKPYVVSKPVNTPEPKLNTLDPRSPTADIVRTPIQNVLSTYVLNLNEEEFRARKLTCDPVDSIPASRQLVSVSDETSGVGTKSSLEFSFNSTEDTCSDHAEDNDISDLEKSDDDVSNPKPSRFVQPPKHISCLAKGKDFGVGLLETNLDYVETDIDSVAKLKNRTNQELIKSRASSLVEPKNILRAKFANTIDNKCTNVTPSKGNDFDPRSPSIEIVRTPIQIVKTLDVDPRSPTVDFERTPIQVFSSLRNADVEQRSAGHEKYVKCESECVVKNRDFSEFRTTKPESSSFECFSLLPSDEESNDCSKSSVTKSTPNIPDMLCFEQTKSNGKISKNVIYEDNIDRKLKSPKQDKSSTPGMSNRTPLSDRNTNRTNCRSKSANGRFKGIDSGKKVNGNVDANDFTISKIPMFRETKKSKNKLKNGIKHSENIPPESSLTDEQKKYRWDNANRTLVI